MRSSLVALGLAAATLLGAAKPAAQPSPPPPLTRDAPADEYFGPFKYSALSIRSKITALGRSYRERWAGNASLLHDAGLAESSFRIWAQKYPNDVWLAPTAFHFAQLYQVIQTPEARGKAKSMYQYVATTFPKSKQAHDARLRLQQGFPPLVAETPVNPTPSPYGPAASPSPAVAEASPAASSAPAASAAPSARASAVPSAAASAAPSASPRPTSSPR